MIDSAWRALRRTVAGPDPAPRLRPPGKWTLPGAAVLVAFGAIATQGIVDSRYMVTGLAVLIGFLSVTPLAMLWLSPLWAWRLAMLGLIIGALDLRGEEAWPWNPVQILVTLIVLFVLALRETLGITIWVILITVALSTLVCAYWLAAGVQNAVGAAMLIFAVMVLGEQIGRRRRIQRDLAVQSERGQIAEAREAVLRERARIARELHDVVAHSMSLVAVRAETAPYRLPDLPAPARDEFLALAGTARESLVEMRRLLGVLRTDPAQLDLQPQPGLSDLDDLIASAREAGMQVHNTILGVPAKPATGLTVYRIVQEALSNAARHAPGTPVTVLVTTTAQATTVTVTNAPSLADTGTQRTPDPNSPTPSLAGSDAGPTPSPTPSLSGADAGPGSLVGHGLMGMHERVELEGGALRAGPAADGGFEVVAVLPSGEKP